MVIVKVVLRILFLTGMRVECLYLKVLGDPCPEKLHLLPAGGAQKYEKLSLYVIVFCECASLFYVL